MACLFPVMLLLLVLGLANAGPPDQAPLGNAHNEEMLSVRAELKKAEIIPTVIDDFIPYISVNVTWPTGKTADLGNTIKPSKTQGMPDVHLSADMTSSAASNMTYTVAMTDPDAPSRDNPEWSEICHWIATNVSLSSASGLDEVMPYYPPGPPEKTGKHRYVLLAFAPANGTTAPLDLTKPADRQHWGYDDERMGVREWADENGLVPVGANFMYEKNKKQ
ncbi:phosphatidylethanolamine-binding protein [Lineolata rhizophorae]|uniref:Phosphatidylethanolamine-binding protein n=1 Tax=Lineolata rhizophorae TaxID=578093 RepID=A0A6A6P7I4_9PEZI|nr:phosphatidylethanolamine-binding protein [Lineolata rhizophorae]